MRHAPLDVKYGIREDIRKLVDAHQFLSFDEAELLILHMIDKYWPEKRYNTFDGLCKIEFGIFQRETEQQILERVQSAEAWFSIYGWPL